MTEKFQCSVGILTFNSGATLKTALESVKDFAEIIVCDGGSTDDTLSLARESGAKILSQDSKWKGEGDRVMDFSGVRNQMLEIASLDWFFYLDSDEVLTPELQKEIDETIRTNRPGAFWVPRKYMLQGEIVDCAATYPTKQIRFFHKAAVNRFIKPIHERIEVKEKATITTMKNFMLVPMHPDPLFHRRKWEHYIELEAKRKGTITLGDWILSCMENGKISLLYGLRYIRNLFFCRGKHMPWKLEWERHIYHIKSAKRFWKLIGK